MVVEKIIPKDKETQEKKYLLFLEFVLNKLKNGRKSGISLRNIANDYKLEMGTTLDRQEQKEFTVLYEDKYFEMAANSLDRIRIKQKGREYLRQQENQSSSKQPQPKSRIYILAQNPIIQIMSIFVVVYSFIKAIEAIFKIDIPYL